MPIVTGFKYDLFISYAHRDDKPFGWVSDFISTLKDVLESKGRDFTLWWDPGLRTGEDFNLAIADAISESAVFLSVLSKAYGESSYCDREVEEFRQQRHPAFGLTVGTLSRMQGIVMQNDFPRKDWPPELRSTSPCPFYSDTVTMFSKPKEYDDASPWINSLWRVRDSIWATLEEMQRQRKSGIAVERSYGVSSAKGAIQPTVYLAEVTDDLYQRRESLRSSLAQSNVLQVVAWAEAAPPSSGVGALSVHLFGAYAGRPAAGADKSLPRLQLEATVAANPARRPLVWLARDLDIDKAEDGHKQFLTSLLGRSDIEVLRMDFEDLKDEVGRRMRPVTAAATKKMRQTRDDPIVHIWHQADDPAMLTPIKEYLQQKNCGISVFNYAASQLEKLQSRLAICDGLVVPYTSTSASKSWAEEVMTEAFRARRREQRPIAFAALQLPPPNNEGFNFEHPRVVPVRATQAGEFCGIDVFLSKLEQDDV